MDSLWGSDFVIHNEPSKTKKIINKINKPKDVKIIKEKSIKSSSISIQQKLSLIYEEVNRILGHYKENTLVIRDKYQLEDYFDKAISNGIISIDTETNNSLQPVSCKLMGPCIYTPGMKQAYIPINHTDLEGNLLSNQLTEKDFSEQLDRLNNTKIIMHNGKFDYEVIKCTCGNELNVFWDTFIGARILNENEKAGLKEQFISKINPDQEKYSIDHLFEDIQYAIVDPDIFALYAATDAYMTYLLYEYQLEQFRKAENKNLYSLFMNIEMKVLIPTAEMELNGVSLDLDYSKRLSEKYHKIKEDCDRRIEVELKKYDDIIDKWRLTEEANFHPKSNKPDKTGNFKLQKSKSEQLKNPVELTSPTQFAILLYDVLKTPVVDKNSPRGTGEEIISKIDLPLCKLVLEKRTIEKLIGTYIDKLPECLNPKDNKIHASFNQLGADTGRFSSSEPNLQNIPSRGDAKSIRCMFKASPGCIMIGADFKAQEPKLLATYSQDEHMIEAYNRGKDLYAVIGTKVYKNNYEDNLEFDRDGALNPEGKKRRSACKSILLG